MSYNDEYMVWFCPCTVLHVTKATSYWDTLRHTPVPTSGRCHTLVHDHTMEEASQTEDEMCLDIGYDMGSMAHDDAGQSHTFAHEDASQSPSTSSTTTPLPTTRMSPPPTTNTAPADVRGRDGMRFMPTPGRPTLVLQGETNQETSEEKKTGMNFDGIIYLSVANSLDLTLKIANKYLQDSIILMRVASESNIRFKESQ
ncbi:hypothetical protein SO802_005986 [Lithocarpus litseifolius]|uniref:Uncharacterized protein n=1 Tax=Lithocarpus litseifolius TaxID=425828 RepID=A0AAW2DJQ3_9ROSI